MKSPRMGRTVSLIVSATLMGFTSMARAADNKGVLNDELGDLSSSVNKLGSKKPDTTGGAKPATNPADVKPSVTSGGKPVTSGSGVLGDDLGDLEKGVNGL